MAGKDHLGSLDEDEKRVPNPSTQHATARGLAANDIRNTFDTVSDVDSMMATAHAAIRAGGKATDQLVKITHGLETIDDPQVRADKWATFFGLLFDARMDARPFLGKALSAADAIPDEAIRAKMRIDLKQLAQNTVR